MKCVIAIAPVAHEAAGGGGFRYVAQRAVDNIVAGIGPRVVRELAGVSEQGGAVDIGQDRRDDNAGIGDDGDIGVGKCAQQAFAFESRERVASGAGVERQAAPRPFSSASKRRTSSSERCGLPMAMASSREADVVDSAS